MTDLRLVIPAAVCWVSALALVAIPAAQLQALALVVAAASFAAAAVALFWLVRTSRGDIAVARRAKLRRAGGVLAVSLAGCGLVSASVAAQVPVRSPIAVEQLAGHTVTVVLTVGSVAVASEAEAFGGTETSLRFTSTATEVSTASERIELRMPVLVFLRSEPPEAGGVTHAEQSEVPQIGSRVRVHGTLKATEPGESVAYLLFVQGGAQQVQQSPWYLSWANGLRNAFRESAQSLPGAGAELVPGLAIGDVSLVSDDLNNSMISSGLSHLTAVSGANCAIVVAAIMLLGGAARLSRRWRIALSVAVMIGFVVLVTPSASVLRAAVMALIVLVTLASGRAPKGLPALSLACLIMLVADPWLSRSYGLALSVLATGGLLVLTRPLQQVLARWLPSWLALVLAVPLAAQLACQPVLVLLSPTVSTYSVVANLLAEPAAPVATVLGLISCLVGASIPAVAGVGAWLTWVPATWIAGVATFFARAPGATLPWAGGALGVVLVVVVSAAGLTALLLREPSRPIRLPTLLRNIRRKSWRGFREARVRHRARSVRATPVQLIRLGCGTLVALLATVYTGMGIGAVVSAGAAWPTNWQIAACDIGQGDAVVVRDSDQIGLIDVGPDPALLTACLQRLGVTRVNLLVLTHYDLDHVGGLSAVLGLVDTAMLGPPEDAHDDRMAAELSSSGAAVEHPTRGQTGALGTLAYTVLWPEAATSLRGNDACVTLQFDGSIRSLFLGDLGEDAQRQLMAANSLQHEDVVKVAHHGSADQSESLYQEIHASIGLISVGANNRYGHPTDRLLGILARSHVAAYRTDLLGMVVLAPSPDGIVVWSEGQARVEKKK